MRSSIIIVLFFFLFIFSSPLHIFNLLIPASILKLYLPSENHCVRHIKSELLSSIPSPANYLKTNQWYVKEQDTKE